MREFSVRVRKSVIFPIKGVAGVLFIFMPPNLKKLRGHIDVVRDVS